MSKETPLQKIVQESGLEQTKAQQILEQFQNYFEIAADWEKKAATIVVTSETQTAEMEMARTGRLFLRDKRIAVEKARKKLKEQALREGQAIDGIAKTLKALIIPIETHLEKQEKFVEIRKAEAEEKRRLEVERRMEEERIAEEKAKAEEQERIRLENEQLKAKAVKWEKKAEAERKKQARILAEQQAKADAEKVKQARILAEQQAAAKAEQERQARILAEQQAKAAAEKKKLEDKAREEKEAVERAAKIEQEKRDKVIAEQKAKAKAERLAAEAEKRKLQAKIEAEQKEKERLASLQVECPFCHKKFIPGEK